MSRLFDFRKHSGEASKTTSASPKTRPCSRFSVFKVRNFVPTRPTLRYCTYLRSRKTDSSAHHGYTHHFSDIGNWRRFCDAICWVGQHLLKQTFAWLRSTRSWNTNSTLANDCKRIISVWKIGVPLREVSFPVLRLGLSTLKKPPSKLFSFSLFNCSLRSCRSLFAAVKWNHNRNFTFVQIGREYRSVASST